MKKFKLAQEKKLNTLNEPLVEYGINSLKITDFFQNSFAVNNTIESGVTFKFFHKK